MGNYLESNRPVGYNPHVSGNYSVYRSVVRNAMTLRENELNTDDVIQASNDLNTYNNNIQATNDLNTEEIIVPKKGYAW